MAKDRVAFNKLIAAIRDGTYNETEINLDRAGLDINDACRLFRSLEMRAEVAGRIIKLVLSNNNIIKCQIPDTLVKLQWFSICNSHLLILRCPDTLVDLRVLDLSYNSLSCIYLPVTLVALRSLVLTRNPLCKFSKLMLRAFQVHFVECLIKSSGLVGMRITPAMLEKHYYPREARIDCNRTIVKNLEAINPVTIVFLVVKYKLGLSSTDNVTYRLLEFVSPKLDFADIIQAYSLKTVFNWLPLDERPSAEIMQAIEYHEDTILDEESKDAKQRLNTVMQQVQVSTKYKMLVAFNDRLQQQNKDIRDDTGYEQALKQIRCTKTLRNNI